MAVYNAAATHFPSIVLHPLGVFMVKSLTRLLSRFWIWVVGHVIVHLPMPCRNALARLVGAIFWYAVPMRRHVIMTNLRLCFPRWSEKQRLQIAHANYVRLARAALDHGVLWKGSREKVQKLVEFEGLEHVLNRDNRPLIVVAPHFVGLDAAGIALNLYVRGVSLYQRQSNAEWDRAALQGRLRFSHPILIAKTSSNDLRPVIRAMREGMPFYYLPDLDNGRRNSVFVPFFGVPAATLPMASRLAHVLKAKVLFCVAHMTDTGYKVHISAPLEGFPTKDFMADTVRLTALLEDWILRYPDQYLWTHRRFKTRPLGEPSLY